MPLTEQKHNANHQRFANMTDAEIDNLVDQRQSSATKKQTSWSVKQLKC